MVRDYANRRDLDLSKEVLLISVRQRAAKLWPVKLWAWPSHLRLVRLWPSGRIFFRCPTLIASSFTVLWPTEIHNSSFERSKPFWQNLWLRDWQPFKDRFCLFKETSFPLCSLLEVWHSFSETAPTYPKIEYHMWMDPDQTGKISFESDAESIYQKALMFAMPYKL